MSPVAKTLLAVLLLAGCSDAAVEDARAAWLRNTLIDDNRASLEREPELTAGKFEKMAAGPYTYFRGTAGQYWRDVRGPGEWAVPTDFGSAATSGVVLVGDPHPENVGSFRLPDGELVVDFNDFDGSRRGPYHFDVRRLATGFWIAAATFDLAHDERAAMARAVVEGYLAQLADGGDLRVDDDPEFGPVVQDLLRRARRDGDAREALDEYTVVGDDGRRSMFYGTVEARTEGLYGDETVEPSDAESSLVEALVASAWDTMVEPPPTAERRVLGVSRRLGAGVSSYPLWRWYVLTEGPTAAVDDDVLLEVKEIVDPAYGGELARRPWGEHANNAARVVANQRTLQVTTTNDAYLSWAADGQHAFKFRERTKYQKNVDVVRLREDLGADWDVDDLTAHANLCGRLLAAAHVRGADDPQALADVAKGGLIDETEDFAAQYGQQILADHRLFQILLSNHGPTLGFVHRGQP